MLWQIPANILPNFRWISVSLTSPLRRRSLAKVHRSIRTVQQKCIRQLWKLRFSFRRVFPSYLMSSDDVVSSNGAFLSCFSLTRTSIKILSHYLFLFFADARTIFKERGFLELRKQAGEWSSAIDAAQPMWTTTVWKEGKKFLPEISI